MLFHISEEEARHFLNTIFIALDCLRPAAAAENTHQQPVCFALSIERIAARGNKGGGDTDTRRDYSNR